MIRDGGVLTGQVALLCAAELVSQRLSLRPDTNEV